MQYRLSLDEARDHVRTHGNRTDIRRREARRLAWRVFADVVTEPPASRSIERSFVGIVPEDIDPDDALIVYSELRQLFESLGPRDPRPVVHMNLSRFDATWPAWADSPFARRVPRD